MRNFILFQSVFLFFLTLPEIGCTHPAGNMIVHGDYLLWPYVYPVDDPEHHACVMIWDKKSAPKPYIISKYPASDWMLYSDNLNLYLIERRYIPEKDGFQFRILKGKVNESPSEIWPWTDDKRRTGEGGFYMESDNSMIFCSFPGIFRMEKDAQPAELFSVDRPVKKLRLISENNMLLIGDNHCHLATTDGKILKTWEHLLLPAPDDPPLGRNMIFDADYLKGDLLIGYWGNRSFELLPADNKKIILKKFDPPWAAHWVAFDGKDIYLFASSIEAGRNPRPKLLKYNDEQNGKITEVWAVD